MNAFVLVFRLVVAVAVTVLLLASVLFVAGEATVAWYMSHYGVPARIELSEDYGFGMLALFVEGTSALLALPFASFVAWRMSGRLARAMVASPLFQRADSGGR